MGCPGETSSTLINGGICPYSPFSSQLAAAVAYLQANAGKVSPVTLDVGANDVLTDTDPSTCTVNVTKFYADVATLDTNLTGTILPALKKALTVKGRITGKIVMMNYYDPLQNVCPNSVKYSQTLNRHLASRCSRVWLHRQCIPCLWWPKDTKSKYLYPDLDVYSASSRPRHSCYEQRLQCHS